MVKLAPSVLLPKHLFAAIRHQQPPIRVAPIVIESAALGPYIGFTTLPTLYWPLLALTLLCYVVLTQVAKAWLIRRRWI